MDLKPGKPAKKKIRRSQWLPALLLLYFAAMACFYGPGMISNGETLRFTVISVVELGVLYLLYLFLRKKEKREK